MDSRKFLLGGIIGGIVYFLLGYLVFGMLLADFMNNHMGSATGVSRGEDRVYWALALGNLFLGFLLSYVFAKANISRAGSGALAGAVIGFLFMSGNDLIMYGVTNLHTKQLIAAHVAAFTLISLIAGAVVGGVRGMGRKVA